MICSNLRFILRSMFALAVCLPIVSQAALVVDVDIDQSHLTPAGISIPLQTFSIPPNENTISFRFTENEQLKLTVPPTGDSPLVTTSFQANTDGLGDDLQHMGGTYSLLDANYQPLPDTTRGLIHIDREVVTPIPLEVIFLASTESIDSSNGQMYVVSGIDFVGGVDFDPATLSGGLLNIGSQAQSQGFVIPGTVSIVPEPSSMALLGLGVLFTAFYRYRN